MNGARLVEILIAESANAPIRNVQEAQATAGRGLVNDRYFSNTGTFSPNPQKPDFEITLIEMESVEEFSRELGLPFTARDARRNLVTTGTSLNDLVGADFFVGEVLLRGIRPCEPCNHLAKVSFPEVLKGLLHKGGLRAQIVKGGQLRVGDAIRLQAS